MQQIVRAAIVQDHAKIRVERLLPFSGEINVRVGQEITPAQTIARAPSDVSFHIVAASDQLGVSPDEAEALLTVEIGEMVDRGTVLLRKKRLLGSDTVESPVEGRVYAFRNGRVVLRQDRHVFELRALLAGKVANYIANRGVILETQGTLIQAPWSSGVESYGALKMATAAPDAPLTADALADDTADRVVAAGTITQPELLQQAVQTDVRGIIAGSMSAAAFELAQSLPIAIIVTEGIGAIPMSRPVWQSLQEWEGQEASLFAQTASGKAAAIVVPHSSKPGQAQPPSYRPLGEGETVRVVRGPLAGQTGTVVKLYERPKITAVHGKARGADVRLAEEQVIFVPYANLQLML